MRMVKNGCVIYFRIMMIKIQDIHFGGVGRSNSKQCIPYKGNEHLLGTTNDCDEFYKNW